MSNILIAGGAGFLGSHLCDVLVQDNTVYCLDDLSTGRICNVQHLINHPNFQMLCQDVCDPIDVEVDEIYNLASPASPIQYQKNPIKTFKTNVYGSMNLLKLAVDNRAKILLASTSEVYGDPTVSVQREDYYGNVNTIGIRACYDESKRASETLFSDFHRMYALPIRIARIFNTYGPRMDIDDGRVISNFICQALRGENITVYGEGTQTRSFCYVKDTVNGLVALMNSDYTKPVNIGDSNTASMIELAKLITIKLGVEEKIKHLPLPEDDPKRRIPDTCLALEVLGWSPETPFDCGLDETVLYFKKQLGV